MERSILVDLVQEADRFLLELNCNKVYNTTNPFDFMDNILLKGKTSGRPQEDLRKTYGRLREDLGKTSGRLQEEMHILMKRVLELTIDCNLHLFWLRIRTQVSLRSLSSL